MLTYDQQGFAHAEDGTRLFYGVRGSGWPTVVLSDGIGCDGFAWTHLHEMLSSRHRVVHWHYRGHGRSGAPVDRDRVDIVQHARDLERVLMHLKVDRAVLAGHSMGVQVSLEGYRLMPFRTQGLGLFCGSYGKVTETFHGTGTLKSVLPKVIAFADKNRGLARALWGRLPPRMSYLLATASGELDGAVLEADFLPYIKHMASVDPLLFLDMLHAAGEHNAEDLLTEIQVPTLVVAAERDTFTPAPLADYMAKKIPGAELFVVQGASHAAPVEQPLLVFERFEEFIQERILSRESTSFRVEGAL